jgi:hypothetical protein
MNQLSLNNAIFSFAFTGVLAPHKRDNELPKPITKTAPKKA